MAGSSSSDTSIISGRNPITYSPANPLTLFLVQAFIIIVFCRLIHLPLSLIRQPKVIGEVIGGIILGPTVMGRVPHFTDAIFPKASMPNINLVAQLGLIFFLFMVGMEIDIPYLRKHWKVAASVGVGSIVLPFALGYAVAVGLYNQFIDSSKHASFGIFGLFIGIAISITALPVLARILTELGLLHDTTGIVVLAAGVSNDIVAWVLLALVISLAQAGAPVDTLYILLAALGWFLLLAVVVRPILHRFLKHTGSLEKGPTEFSVVVIVLLIFVSAFFTDIIGVHSIFGAFIAGAIIPRENNFPARLTAKIEDLISAVFIPIYFALSGQNVDFSALNDGVTWGYTILIIVVAFVGKVVGAAVPARLLGLSNKDAIETGILMSCKGLVELVILNIGLETGILNTKIFSMFVLMAIVTTFSTTPLTLIWRSQMEKRAKRKAIDSLPNDSNGGSDVPKGMDFKISKIVLAFDNVEMLPSNMILTQMLANPPKYVSIKPSSKSQHDASASVNQNEVTDDRSHLSTFSSYSTINHNYISAAIPKNIFVSAVHLVDLTDRTADLIQAMASDFIPGNEDPVMKVMNTFTAINRIPFEGAMSIAPQADRTRIIMSLSENLSDVLLISWDDFQGDIVANSRLFSKQLSDFSMREGLPNIQAKVALFSSLFVEARSHVCAFIDRGFAGNSSDFTTTRQIIVPFFGGNDDWLAFGIALYLARSEHVRITILVASSADEIQTTPSTKSPQTSPANSPKRISSPSFFSSLTHTRTPNTEVSDHASAPDTQGSDKSRQSNTVWESVASVYNTLPADLQSSVVLTKFNFSRDEDASQLSYTEALKLYRLQSHDLILIGRSTPDSSNDIKRSDSATQPIITAAETSLVTAPTMGRAATSSSNASSHFAMRSSRSQGDSDAGECLFGNITTEIVTSSELSCSFLVCQSLHLNMNPSDRIEEESSAVPTDDGDSHGEDGDKET